MKMILVLMLVAVALGGCVTTGDEPIDIATACKVLGPVIKVNTKNKNSDWHAGKLLAKRVYQNDDTGANLHCNGY